MVIIKELIAVLYTKVIQIIDRNNQLNHNQIKLNNLNNNNTVHNLQIKKHINNNTNNNKTHNNTNNNNNSKMQIKANKNKSWTLKQN